MVSYRTFRPAGLMTGVAAAAIMAAGVAWAVTLTCDATFNDANAPSGTHLRQNSADPECVVGAPHRYL